MVVLALTALLLVGIATLLWVPVQLRLTVDTDDVEATTWQVRWLGFAWDGEPRDNVTNGDTTEGGAERATRRHDATDPSETANRNSSRRSGRDAQRRADTRRQRRRRHVASWWHLVAHTPELLRHVVRLVAQLLRVLWPREVEAVFRVGLDDPAAVGGLMGALQGMAHAWPHSWRLGVEPDFVGSGVAARGRAMWSVRLGALLWPILCFLTTPIVWRVAWATRRS